MVEPSLARPLPRTSYYVGGWMGGPGYVSRRVDDVVEGVGFEPTKAYATRA